MRILKEHLDFSDFVSRVLTFDYIGALIASLLFPILLVPYLGLVRTSLVFGLLNALVGLWGTYLLRPLLTTRSLAGFVAALRLRLGCWSSVSSKPTTLTQWSEEIMLGNTIVYAKQTPFQRIVVTENARGFQLHLNGNLQFNSADEYRYHEALVHPAMSAVDPSHAHLGARRRRWVGRARDLEVSVGRTVTFVDIDPAMTDLARELEPLQSA